MPIFNNMLAGASGQGGAGYQIERSLRFNPVDTPRLSKTFASTSTTFTASFWLKRSNLPSSSYQHIFSSTGASSCSFEIVDNVAYLYNQAHQSSSVYLRDPSAWYHIVLSVTAGTCTLYINNSSVLTGITGFSYGGYSTIGSWIDNTYNLDGYLADVHFIDGQALAPTDFGKTDDNGVWVPKEYDGGFDDWFDNSQTWSNYVTGTAYGASYAITNGFNGIITGNNRAGGGLTFTPASPIACTKVRIYMVTYAAPASTIYLNGVDIASQIPITNGYNVPLEFTPSNNQFVSYQCGAAGAGEPGWFGMIELLINGRWVALIDSGASVGNNSFHLDFADNSSDAALGTDTSGNSNTWDVTNLNATGASSPLLNVDISTSLELYVTASGTGEFVYVNGIDVTSQITFSSWSTITGVGTVLNSVKATGNASGTVYYALSGIKANGSWLIDTGTANPPTPNIIKDWSINYEESNQYASRPITKAFDGVEGSYSNSFVGQTGGNVTNSDIDSLVDSPTNGTQTDTGAGGEVVGNYATLNPLDKRDSPTFSNGNLQVNGTTAVHHVGRATFAVSSGKYYWETTINSAISGTFYPSPGICSMDGVVPSQLGDGTSGYAYMADGQKYTSATLSSYGATFTNGDIIGFALDLDAGTLTAYKNGASQGVLASGLTGSWSPSWNHYGATSLIYNFGQRAFSYPVSGYKSLNTANLPEPTIADGSKYFDTKLYTGNSGTQSITTEFSPDLVWIKNRVGTDEHMLFNAISGPLYRLNSSNTNTELSQANTLTAFNSNGFTLGSDGQVNQNTETYVSWNWDAGDTTTTIAAGGLNSSLYDQSQTWSGQITGDNYSGYPKTQAFNNNIANYCLAGQDKELVFTPSPSFSSATTVKIWYYAPTLVNDAIKINGTGVASNVATTGSVATHTFTVSGFTSLSWSRGTDVGGNSYDVGIARIDVDGVQLVDSGVSVPNVPTIASTVRANPSAGSSIVSYAGALSSAGSSTIGHGLGAAPSLIIVKNRDAAANWVVYHQSIGNAAYLILNGTNAQTTGSSMWGTATPTSTSFTAGYSSQANLSGNDYIAYCFAPVEGYSAMGSYTGNGLADGPFVYTGFRPAFIMFKLSSSTGNWYIYDTARDEFNSTGYRLYPNLSNGGSTSNTNAIDILSNGFKLTSGAAGLNASSGLFIYATFAENPFKTARAR